MTLLPFRTGRRALSLVSAVGLTPALFVGMIAPGAPALALRQDANAADTNAPAKKDEMAYTIQRKFKTSDVDKYQINVVISGGLEATLDMLLKETTKDAKATGGAVMVDEFEKASATFNGTDQELTSAMPVFTTTRDKMGKVTDTKMEGGNPLITQSPISRLVKGFLQLAVYPTKPIKVGETWSYASDPKDMEEKVKGTATLLALETVNGLQTFKIKTVSDTEATVLNPMTGENINVKQHSEGVQNLDVATGKVVKVKATSSSATGNDMGKGEITMSLVTDKNGDKKSDDKKGDAKKSDAKTDAKPEKPGN